MEQTTNGTTRRALGRGLPEILGECPESEGVRTAESAYRIAAILEGCENRQVENVFQFIRNIRRTANGESIEELGEGLHRLERERREKSEKPKRRWFGRKMK